jgi:5-methylcytosine-specific restriction protein B
VLQRFHEDRGLNVAPLLQKLTEINTAIGDPDFHLGITFFLDEHLIDRLPGIWKMEIEPYIEELFFDDRGKAESFRWEKVRDEVDLSQ